jgi:hypothetical protein
MDQEIADRLARLEERLDALNAELGDLSHGQMYWAASGCR